MRAQKILLKTNVQVKYQTPANKQQTDSENGQIDPSGKWTLQYREENKKQHVNNF